MDRDKPKTQQQDKQQRTTSLLQILTRRSTKVEPQQQQPADTVSSLRSNRGVEPGGGGGGSVSAHSSPVNQFRNLRRHSSTQNISTCLAEEPSPAAIVNSRKKNTSSLNTTSNNQNRFSHQFSLCCSIDDRSTAPTPPPPPISVRYNSFKQNDPAMTTTAPKSPVHNHSEQNGITIVSVHKSPPPATNSNSVDTTAASPVKEQVKPPVFNEYAAKGSNHQSIAMSACRSRLRQKLLPPGQLTAADFGVESHFSSPNITVGTDATAGEGDGGNNRSSADTSNARSLSYDILTGVRRPTSADSLAKQSLIAAQLLNLIPAERVRER